MKFRFSFFLFIFSLHFIVYSQGPGGVRTNSDAVLWLRSDKGLTYDANNNLTDWADQSNANDATNAATSTNPFYVPAEALGTNAEAGITFDRASSEFLDIANDANINSGGFSERTIFLVVKTGSNVTDLQYIYQQGDAAEGLFVEVESGNLTFGINGSSSEYSISAAVATATTYLAVFTYDGSGATLDLKVNGTSTAQVPAVASSIAAHSTIKLGSSTSSSDYFSGSLGELIYFDVALNTAEELVVSNYLSEKFGISIGADDLYSGASSSFRNEVIGVGIETATTDEHTSSTGQGGTLYLTEHPSDLFSAGEYAFAGNNAGNLSSTSADIASGAGYARYQRIWYISKTGAAGITIEFDLVEAGLTVGVVGDYELLTRAGTSGDFAEETNYTKTINGNKIQFDVPAADFATGYFSLAIPDVAKKWYTLNSGTWDDPNTWTLDPAGAVVNNDENLTPSSSPTAAADQVFILSGKTVTLDNDNDISSTLTQLTVNGILDFVGTSNHETISELLGNGTIRLSGYDDDANPSTTHVSNLPVITDGSNFTDEGTGGGTFEFYGSEDIALGSDFEAYNLDLAFDDVSDKLIVAANLTINNNLNVTTGDFQINDASTTMRSIVVEGDVTVNATGAISTGTGNPAASVDGSNYYTVFNQLEIKGDFTNSGTVAFHNEAFPVFRSGTSTGATTVTFSGTSDNTVSLNNTTSFYNLRISKGSDRSYTLVIDASAKENFYLFGENDLNSDGLASNSNPSYSGKALWIENGTLELQGSVKIPTLIELVANTGTNGGDSPYFIPENSKLIVNGNDVEVRMMLQAKSELDDLWGDFSAIPDSEVGSVLDNAGNHWRNLVLHGHFQIDEGTFDFNNAAALQYDAETSPIIEINGGEFIVTQIRSYTNNSGGDPSYIQTDGTVTVTGNSNGGNALINGGNVNGSAFSFTSTESVFTMTGGDLIIKDVRTGQIAINGLNVLSEVGNYNVTGGNITIEMGSGQASAADPFEINFTPNFYNLNILEDDGHPVEVFSHLVIANDLTITSGMALDLQGNDISIGRNFDLESGATYTQGGDNITTFFGEDADQTLLLLGTFTTPFYDLIFSGAGLKTVSSGDMTISNSLTIESGSSLNDGGQTIFAQGSMTNSGTHVSATGGSIEFSGGSATYGVDGDDSGVFGNVNLNDAVNDVSFTADQTITGVLTFAQDQLLDIGTHSLVMSGAAASISGAGTNRYIVTAGNDSDGGLSLYVDANETLAFPIGTDANAVTRYTPVTATLTSFADDGYITVNPIDKELATLDQTSADDQLTFYWKSVNTDFDTDPDISYVFSFIDAVDDVPAADDPATEYAPGWVTGTTRVIDPVNSTAGSGMTSTSLTTSTHDLVNARYTAADPSKFAGTIQIYYSRRNGEWHDIRTWSLTEGGTALTDPLDLPGEGDIVQIGTSSANHHVAIGDGVGDFLSGTNYAPITVAQVSILREGGAESSILSMEETAGAHDFGIVTNREPGSTTESGAESKIAISGPALPAGDFGEFNTAPSTIFTFSGRFPGNVTNARNIPVNDNTDDGGADVSFQSIGSYTIGNTITEYPTLQFESSGGSDANATVAITLPDVDIVVNNDMRLFITSGFDNYIKFNTAGTTVEVRQDIEFRSTDATVEFPATGSPSNLRVWGDIDFDSEARNAIIAEDAAGTVNHKIQLYGSIINPVATSDITLYRDASSPTVSLEFQSEENSTFESFTSVPSLYELIVNKGSDPTHEVEVLTDFTVPAPAASFQPITLTNGTLRLNNAAIGDANDVVLTNTANGDDFEISSSAGLTLEAGSLLIEGDDVGLFLDGALSLEGTSILNINGGNNNYIEYSSSGSATLSINGTASLNVGSQIRRNTVSSLGVLSYSQSGGTVTIGASTGGSPATNRSMLDVSGTGSSFTMSGGTLIIANDISTSSIPSLYLAPSGTGSITAGTIQFGNSNTVSGANALTIQSELTVYDLVVDDAAGPGNYPALTLLNLPLNIANDLTIDANANLDAAGFALAVGGDFNNAGGASGFTANGNTTTLNGSSTQLLSGDGTTFHNLVKSASNTLQLAAATDIVISNNLTISDGTLDDNDNDISVIGTLTNNSIHTNTAGSATNFGISLDGSTAQTIAGTGTFSRLRVNNSAGVTVTDDISITDQVILNGGTLDIEGNELSLDDDAYFVDGTGSGFSFTNMVETRRSFTDAGIVKVFNGTDPTGDGVSNNSFIFPIGSGDKYTPLQVTLTQNSATTATIAVRAADEVHPNVTNDVDVPEFTDTDNVLQYYWEISSVGMTDFIGELEFTYQSTDAYVTSPFTLEDYYTARLLPDDSDNWNKIETGFNYLSADGESTITFDLSSSSGDAQIGGDYTAGIEDAVPDQVETIASVTDGNWEDGATWDSGSVPRGAIVVIDAGDVVTMTSNALVAYRTEVNGELIIGSTTNHRLGSVSGNGTIRINSGSFPAGDYTDFFDCSTGGSVDFGGVTSYTLPTQVSSIRNLEISDGGTKSLPNTDVVVCGDLIMNDGAVLSNPQNKQVTVEGNLLVNNGTVNVGSSAAVNMIVEGDGTITSGTVNISNTKLFINGSLTINGGVVTYGSSGTLDIDTDLSLNSGTMNGASSAQLLIGGNLSRTTGFNFLMSGTTNTTTLNGTSAQSISGDFTGSNAFRNFTLNNTSGGITIVDAGNNDMEVVGTLTFTSGVISTNSSNTLTIMSTGSSAGGSAGSYVSGPLTRNGLLTGTTYNFQIGSGVEYAKAVVSSIGTASQNWTAQFTPTNANNAQPIDITTNPAYGELEAISVNGAWTITSSGTNTAKVGLGIQSHMDVLNSSDTRVAVYDNPTSGEWVNLGGVFTGTVSDGTLTSISTASFSSRIFAVGGINNSTLPVELLSFTGEIVDNDVMLSWTTASELANDYFVIEYSRDGKSYLEIGVVDGGGYSSSLIDYTYKHIDAPFGFNYYRLKQVDFDGQFEIHNTILVDHTISENDLELTISPNPGSESSLRVVYSTPDNVNPVTISITDLLGREIYNKTYSSESSIIDEKPLLGGDVKEGIYLLRVMQNTHSTTSRILIRD